MQECRVFKRTRQIFRHQSFLFIRNSVKTSRVTKHTHDGNSCYNNIIICQTTTCIIFLIFIFTVYDRKRVFRVRKSCSEVCYAEFRLLKRGLLRLNDAEHEAHNRRRVDTYNTAVE